MTHKQAISALVSAKRIYHHFDDFHPLRADKES